LINSMTETDDKSTNPFDDGSESSIPKIRNIKKSRLEPARPSPLLLALKNLGVLPETNSQTEANFAQIKAQSRGSILDEIIKLKVQHSEHP
jgi:hypothetical protein